MKEFYAHHIELDARHVVQRAVVVLGLEAQVALHVDLDFRHGPVEVLAQLRDVVLDQVELAVGLWDARGKL
jgi:hypothetical protein